MEGTNPSKDRDKGTSESDHLEIGISGRGLKKMQEEKCGSTISDEVDEQLNKPFRCQHILLSAH